MLSINKQLLAIVSTYSIAIRTMGGDGERRIFQVIRRLSDADIYRFEGGFTFNYLTLMYTFSGERRRSEQARNGMQLQKGLCSFHATVRQSIHIYFGYYASLHPGDLLLAKALDLEPPSASYRKTTSWKQPRPRPHSYQQLVIFIVSRSI